MPENTTAPAEVAQEQRQLLLEQEQLAIITTLNRLLLDKPTNRSLLDIGCHSESFINAAQKAGYLVDGMALNDFAARQATKKLGINIHTLSAIQTVKDSDQRYDVVTLIDAFEDLADPQSTVQSLHGILADNGILVVTSTDFNHLIPKILGKQYADFRSNQDHRFFLGKKQLLAVVTMNGFRLLKTESQNTALSVSDFSRQITDASSGSSTLLKKLLLPTISGLKYNAYFAKNPFKSKETSESRTFKSPVKLTVVIPVYNEEKTIERVIERVLSVKIKKAKIDLIVVDDGSTDNSRILLSNLKNTHDFQLILKSKNGGKGSAIREGINQASGDIVLIQDADLEYDPNDYEKLIAPIVADNADAVYGSRFLSPERRVMKFWHTYGNKFLTFLCNLVVNRNITDMETCYKVMRTDIAKSLQLRSKRFDVEPEITCKLARAQHRIYEVPIRYHARTFKEGKKIGMKDLFQAIWAIFKFGVIRLK